MDDAEAVRVGDRVHHRDDIGQERQSSVEIGCLGNDLLERAAVAEELHDVERLPVRSAARIIDRQNCRMLKSRRDGSFTPEALLTGVRPSRGQELLYCNGTVEHLVVGGEYPAQPAA